MHVLRWKIPKRAACQHPQSLDGHAIQTITTISGKPFRDRQIARMRTRSARRVQRRAALVQSIKLVSLFPDPTPSSNAWQTQQFYPRTRW